MRARNPIFIRLTVKQQALFAKHSGIPISRALIYIRKDASSPSVAYIMRSLQRSVSEGLPLSKGMMEFPQCFSSFSVGFIQAGEFSGKLSNTLVQLATLLTKKQAVRSKIYSALTYPALIFVATIGISLFLTLVIFPKIVPVLKGFKTTLPLPTRILIWLNAFLGKHWIVVLISILVLIVGIVVSLRISRIRAFYEKFFLTLPIFSQIFTYYAITTFCRTIALQLESGIGILPALALVRTALPGSIYPKTVLKIEEEIVQGRSLSIVLSLHKKLFPTLVCQMIAAGEATGTLSENLESLATLYEEQLDELTKNLTVLIEPVLMVCMGLLVGFVALAIITPIYSVTQNLSGISPG
jgi:type IV pilus assembly protein PilC